MDARCIKFWEDGQALVQAAADAARLPQAIGKMAKELSTMSRFLQKNQSPRFSETAQQKMIDAIAMYVTFSKQHVPAKTRDEEKLLDATFKAVKDGLAMPFNVFGTKQKKRLLKWYNELIGVVGEEPDSELVKGLEGDAAPAPRIVWSVMDIDAEGYLALLNVESGDTSESFQVKKKSAEFKQIKKGFETADVTVVTVGDEVVEINVSEE